jgi:glutamate-1-semialdehyde aminotransferase
MSNALNSDPVVAEIMMRLHKYNHKSKFSRVSARAIETALGTIALGPDFVGAGGRLALGTFVAATGGPEQAKMMKEAYFSKRLESRSNVLNDETHLALQNYQLGALTRNSVLMAAAEAIVQQMAGPEVLQELFANDMSHTASHTQIRGTVPKLNEHAG